MGLCWEPTHRAEKAKCWVEKAKRWVENPFSAHGIPGIPIPKPRGARKDSRASGFAGGTGANPGALQSGRRYEYDGLNLLRVDELYDSNSNGLTEDDAWRRLEVNTHGPGTLGALIGKRVYTHTNNDSTPDATNDYTYTYDAVGNVLAVYNANSTNRGNELYYFSQDAFGNELSNDGNLPTWQRINLLGGSQWGTARTAGITEHQTGKWIDTFTGLYFFHARWLDAGVGRFVGRDPVRYRCSHHVSPYTISANCPARFTDPTGMFEIDGSCFVNLDNNDGFWRGVGELLGRCARIQSGAWPVDGVPEEFITCMIERCNDNTPIRCTSPNCSCSEDSTEAPAWGWVEQPPSPEDWVFGARNCDGVAVCTETLNLGGLNSSPPIVGGNLMHEFGHCCGCTHDDMRPTPGHSNAGRCEGLRIGPGQ
ncbi:MAG: hypothetical protein GHCLOJNM_00521 [bacterium]|nr:hypothetical protein [bacterium]